MKTVSGALSAIHHLQRGNDDAKLCVEFDIAPDIAFAIRGYVEKIVKGKQWPKMHFSHARAIWHANSTAFSPEYCNAIRMVPASRPGNLNASMEDLGCTAYKLSRKFTPLLKRLGAASAKALKEKRLEPPPPLQKGLLSAMVARDEARASKRLQAQEAKALERLAKKRDKELTQANKAFDEEEAFKARKLAATERAKLRRLERTQLSEHKRELRNKVQAVVRIIRPETDRVLFMDVVEWWMKEMTHIRSTTKRALVSNVSRLNREFGLMPFEQITQADIQDFAQRLAVDFVKPTGEQLTVKTQLNCLLTLNQIHAFGAVRLKLPRLSKVHPTNKSANTIRTIELFTRQEVRALIAAIRSDFQDYLTVRFETGLKPAEIHGLTWDKISFKNGTLLLDQVLSTYGRSETEPAPSPRTIELSQECLQALQRQYASTAVKSRYVFCTKSGRPKDNKNFLDRVWYPLLKSVGIAERSTHHMHHTTVVMWLSEGRTPHWIARQLGKSHPGQIVDMYQPFVPVFTGTQAVP